MSANIAITPELQWAIDQSRVPKGRLDVARFVHGVEQLPDQERLAFLSAMDEVQIRSKLWLIDELTRHRDLSKSRLVVLGGWYGILPLLMNWRVAPPPYQMTCIDFDPHVCDVGRRLIGSLYRNVFHECADVMDLDYERLGTDPSSVVINTICEHLPDLTGWWQGLAPGQFVVVQSNNYFACPDHVNAVHSLDELKRQTSFSDLIFEGVLSLSIMDRYMLIGHR